MVQEPKKTAIPGTTSDKSVARLVTKPATKPAPLAPPEPPEATAGAGAGQLVLKVKDLVDRVTEATGGKRGDIKEAVEATLAVLGRALDAGEILNLPPIGKIRVAKPVAEDGSGAMTIKVRKGNPAKPAKAAKEPKAPKVNGAGGKGKGQGQGKGPGQGAAKGNGQGNNKGKVALAEVED